MGFVVRFEDYVPGQRDDRPWTHVRIEEGAARSGPWTMVDTQALDPVDSDPTNPQHRDFTTTEASSATGWFRVVFLDLEGNEQNTPPVYFPAPGVRPTLEDIQTLLWARTQDRFGNVGSFSTETRPTEDQVGDMIDLAVADVAMRLGFIPEGSEGSAREAAALKACMEIERSYYPEQANDDASAYNLFRQDWMELMRRLEAALNVDTREDAFASLQITTPLTGSTRTSVYPESLPT